MKECDLIMKGGITSGIVYPSAIARLAQEYRFRNIGGTSAGAIAAVFAGAAEYRRQVSGEMDGFEEIKSLSDEFGENLGRMFQPTPSLGPIYGLFMAALKGHSRAGKLSAMIWSVIRSCFIEVGILGALGIAALSLAFFLGYYSLGVLILLLCMLTGAGLVSAKYLRLIFKELPANDFGVCSGRTMNESGPLGFSDWVAEKIDTIAGLHKNGEKNNPPLTVGALRRKGIVISAMTTDLSSARPYQLPLQSRIHFFSKAEFTRLFPENIVAYLCEKGGKRESRTFGAGAPDDLYQLPVGDDFPVHLVARMSLSFPGLICGVPLWRPDYTHRNEDGIPLRRCLFSDGGISSNFPIHFFDGVLPVRPTFGIALTALEPQHQCERIDLPTKGRQSTSRPIKEITGVPGFLFSILDTAKDWQDSMQSLLPGYAERIVSVRLDESREGGINLNMDPGVIKSLTDYGRQAGEALLNQFSFDQHRYNRAISVLPALAVELTAFRRAYAAAPGTAGFEKTYPEVLKEIELKHFDSPKKWRMEILDRFAQALASLGEQEHTIILKEALKDAKTTFVPSSDSKIRLLAQADRVPRKSRRAGTPASKDS